MDELLTWQAGDWVPGGGASDSLLVADSWLVEDGRARGLDLHLRRFTSGCAEAVALPAAAVTEFWRAALHRLPREGALFPRVELVGPEPRLRLRIRPAPQRHPAIRVWLSGRPDQRRFPRRKGPDLAWLGELRSAALAEGADDALLTTPSGLVLESGTASLFWWDNDTLCVPDPTLPVLSGVTARLILSAAATRGVPVVSRRARLADLAGRETWLANALHGIRPVTAWVGADVPPGQPRRADLWREWWQSIAAPLDHTLSTLD